MCKLRSVAALAIAVGLGPAACVADPLTPCDAFDAGEAADNQVVRAYQGPIAAFAMDGAFLLRNLCDGPEGQCRLDTMPLDELAPGSQVMLTTAGHHLVGIDHAQGGVWTYEFDEAGRLVNKSATVVHETTGPAQLVIGMRDSDTLIVRDRRDRLAMYQPGAQTARALAPELGARLQLAAVGEQHVALRVPRGETRHTLYLVALIDSGSNPGSTAINPGRPVEIATGDITSVVFGPGDGTLVISEGRGTEASVLVFDVGTRVLVDAFQGEVISSRRVNQDRDIEELPGLHAISPSGDQLAYRTTSGALAVRRLGAQSSCLVRNTNRLGTAREPTRKVGDHALAGFSADGIIYAEYTVGRSDSYVYTYDPRRQQIVPLGTEQGGWHLSAVPGRVTDPAGDAKHLWAVGVRNGSHASIGEGGVNGQTVGRQLIFMPRADEGVWAIDTDDRMIEQGFNERALSVRRVAPPDFANGSLRFDQDTDDQIVEHYQAGQNDNPERLRVPLSGRLCLSTGTPGSWAYRCGDSTGRGVAITTNSGTQERTNDPNVLPEFDPPFPDQGEGDGNVDDDGGGGNGGPARD